VFIALLVPFKFCWLLCSLLSAIQGGQASARLGASPVLRPCHIGASAPSLRVGEVWKCRCYAIVLAMLCLARQGVCMLQGKCGARCRGRMWVVWQSIKRSCSVFFHHKQCHAASARLHVTEAQGYSPRELN